MNEKINLTGLISNYNLFYEANSKSLGDIGDDTLRFTKVKAYRRLLDLNIKLVRYLESKNISNVLDVGTGTGFTKLILSQNNIKVTSVERVLPIDIDYHRVIREYLNIYPDYNMSNFTSGDSSWELGVPIDSTYDCALLFRFIWEDMTRLDLDDILKHLNNHTKTVVIIINNLKVRKYIESIATNKVKHGNYLFCTVDLD